MHSLKSWTTEKQQSEVLVKEEKKKLVSQMEKNMPDLLVGLVLFFFFLGYTAVYHKKLSAAWIIPVQSYRLSAESEQSKGRNNKLCVALHPGLLIA